MERLTFFGLPNEQSQELLEKFLSPICRRHGLQLVVAGEKENRATAMIHQRFSTFVVWDCSVEGPENVYRAFNMWSKLSKKNLLVSRTPLPRNVLAHHQCAPIHGHTLTNDVLAEWLDSHIFAVLRGTPATYRPQRSDLATNWWLNRPGGYFLSFRGSHQAEAERWREMFQQESRTTVRMVPPNEYSYPTEVVTQQQMWEGVARLGYEMHAAGHVIIFQTGDYFDSFWTSSELLLTLARCGWNGRRLISRAEHDRPGWGPLTAEFVASPHGTALLPFKDGIRARSIPGLAPEAIDRLTKLLNNGDPLTSAPETQVPPEGLAKLIALITRRRLGFYDPEFMSEDYWHVVRVPCPRCRPRGRRPEEVDWFRHMHLADSSPAVDYFGYFPARREELERGTVRCPGCGSQLRLVNRRGVRTLWVPVMTTERDQDRPVIQEHKVWEVETS